MKVKFWAVLSVASLLLASLRTMGDNDVWFQLLAGRYFLDHGTVPRTDFFIYPGHGSPQMFGGWGFGALLELAMRAGGPVLASLLNASIWTGGFVLAFCAALRRGGFKLSSIDARQMLIVSVAGLMCYQAIAYRVAFRAESTLFFAWTASICCFEFARARGKGWIAWVFFPAAAWAEAMLHTGGFMLFGAAASCAALDFDSGPDRFRKALGWGSCFGAMALLPILNPNGADQAYLQLFDAMRQIQWAIPQIGAAPAPIPDNATVSASFVNIEYLPVWDGRIRPQWGKFGLAFAVLSWICAAAAFSGKARKGRLFEAAVCCGLFALACLKNRGISLAIMAMLVPAMVCAMEAGAAWERKRSASGPASSGLLAGLALLASAMAVPLSMGLIFYGLPSQELPSAKTAAAIKAAKPGGARIFTRETGPMLAYALADEKYLISMGGHSLVTNAEAYNHNLLTLNGSADWQRQLDHYGVDFACLDFYLPMPGGGMFYWLPSFLVSSPEWKMHGHYDGGCNLFERLPKGEELKSEELDGQLWRYLSYLASFENASYYGTPDPVGDSLAKKAKAKMAQMSAQGRAPRPGASSEAAR